MSARKPPHGDFRTILELLSRRHDTRRIFDAFVRFAACALAASTREPEYVEEAKRWKREELDLFAEAFAALAGEMGAHPFEDIIGGYYMEFALSSKGQRWNGEFHTPKPICDMMARMMIGDMDTRGQSLITVCEPACGAGAMILSIGEACPLEIRRRLRVTAIDINRTACDMAFINTTMWRIPTRVIHGDSLTNQFWAAWSNIHIIAPWLPYELRTMAPEAKEQGLPPKPIEVERIAAALMQQELAL